jgi:hypothetical protein
MRKRLGIAAAMFTCVVAGAIVPGLASAKGPHVCSGTEKSPGVLSGKFTSGVEVKGVCTVNDGPARVIGTLQLEPGSVLVAAFGRHHSHLSVSGDVNINRGATLLLGCNPASSPCVDDPNPKHPTLTSKGHITGNLTATAPLGVIIHSSTIGSDLHQTGGGGGFNCKPPKVGPFGAFKSPVFSSYEDTAVKGNLSVSKIKTCWLGVARVRVGGNLSLLKNNLGDPDAIEVLSNTIQMNLVCRGNSPHLWDSAETTNKTFPRKLERNTVDGTRFGQCVKAGPLKKGGPPAGGPF